MSYVIGVDVGSTYTKAVILSPEKEVVGHAMTATGFKLDKASEKVFDKILKDSGLAKDEIGYAKDRLAAKPMVKFENDDLIAIASEEVSLNRLFPGHALNTSEPSPGTFDTWQRST